jgi:putative nucleotidyltransferase with HDIG domain
MVDALSSHKRFLLRLNDFKELHSDYLTAHAVQTTLLALVLARALKMSHHKAIDLGISCLLHEIGLLKIPQELLDESRILNEDEKRLLTSHVILGANILKSYGLPQEVIEGVLHHHERLNGTGYLYGLKSPSIGLYARIIAIACSYHAQIYRRPYQAGARSQHDSLLDIISTSKASLQLMPNNADQLGLYDYHLASLLTNELSLYPLGSYVILSDESIAQVVEANTENPLYPKVKILQHKGCKKTTHDHVPNITLNKNYTVVHVLSEKEVESFTGIENVK